MEQKNSNQALSGCCLARRLAQRNAAERPNTRAMLALLQQAGDRETAFEVGVGAI